jgi:chorismate mutase/prephenate dehydrogenase
VTEPPRDPREELAECRTAIEDVDRRIVQLLAARVALGRRTAELKSAAGLPLLDPRREAEVIRRVTTLGREEGMPTEAIREIFWQIVGMCRRAQEDPR